MQGNMYPMMPMSSSSNGDFSAYGEFLSLENFSHSMI
jgi:hypothetical protein